jgi:hypothetical protein
MGDNGISVLSADEAMDGPFEEDVPVVEAPEETGSSIISDLRRRQQEVHRERHIDKEIPGYGGQMFARYRLFTFAELSALVPRRGRGEQSEQNLRINVDLLAKACEEILVRKDGELIPLAQEAQFDAPVRYDARLAELLGIDASKARDVVLKTFGADLVLSAHADDLVEWMRNASDEADEDFLGESRGSPSS